MNIEILAECDKKYQIIYADPPWQYKDKRNTHPRICGGALTHYPTLSTEEICAFPIKNISHENCALFIWATFPNILETFRVIEAWGFTYKTLGFSWIKTNKISNTPCFGIGYYTKSNCEVCLLAIRGKMRPVSNSISSVIISPRREHSRKPDETKSRIVELFGNIPRIELFARQETEGWDSFGNEITGKIEWAVCE